MSSHEITYILEKLQELSAEIRELKAHQAVTPANEGKSAAVQQSTPLESRSTAGVCDGDSEGTADSSSVDSSVLPNSLPQVTSALPVQGGGENTAFHVLAQIQQIMGQLRGMEATAFVSHALLDQRSGNTAVQLMWLEEMLKDDSQSAARICLAMAHEHRVKILKLLAREQQTTAQLSEATGLEGGPFYHHLKELINARLVEQVERSVYTITPEGFDTLMTVLALNRRLTYKKPKYWGEDHES